MKRSFAHRDLGENLGVVHPSFGSINPPWFIPLLKEIDHHPVSHT